MGGSQNLSGRRGEEKNIAPTGTRTPNPRRLALSQSLYRLRYPAPSSSIARTIIQEGHVA
jgi:hypothetical protein